jgi:PAS domain-containing protein
MGPFHQLYSFKNIVYEIIRKNDGTRRIVEDSVSLISDENGKPKGFRTVSRDITNRRKTEASLAENRVRLEAIFKSVQDAIITVDLNLNVTEANHAAASICGLNIKAIKKKPFSQCLKNCSRACEDVLLHTLEKKTAVKDYRVKCRTAWTLIRRQVSAALRCLITRAGLWARFL